MKCKFCKYNDHQDDDEMEQYEKDQQDRIMPLTINVLESWLVVYVGDTCQPAYLCPECGKCFEQ